TFAAFSSLAFFVGFSLVLFLGKAGLQCGGQILARLRLGFGNLGYLLARRLAFDQLRQRGPVGVFVVGRVVLDRERLDQLAGQLQFALGGTAARRRNLDPLRHHQLIVEAQGV